MLTVRDVMVRRVVTVGMQRTAKQAAEVMVMFGIGSVVVIEDEKAVGMVTESDILERVVAAGRDPVTITVQEIMSKPVIDVAPDTPLEDAVVLMFDHRIKKLPVVETQGDTRKLLGIVTLTDIARVQPMLLTMLKQLYSDAQEKPPKGIEKVMNFYVS